MYVSCTVHHLPSGVKYKSGYSKMSEQEFRQFFKLLKDVDELAHLHMRVRGNSVFIPPNVLKESVFTLKKTNWRAISVVKNVIAKLFQI